jgi:hypothetical protein
VGNNDYLAVGDWNAICHRCGRKFKASKMKKNWQGFWTCREDWEPRHPQDFVRAIPDKQAPPWIQPPGADTFVSFCTVNGKTALPEFAIPGCMIPSYVTATFI